MKDSESAIMLATSEAQDLASEVQDVVERLRVAMKHTVNHWLVQDKDQRFRCAIGGAILTCEKGSMEYKRILASVEAVKLLASKKIDTENLIGHSEWCKREGIEIIPLIGIWQETIKEHGGKLDYAEELKELS